MHENSTQSNFSNFPDVNSNAPEAKITNLFGNVDLIILVTEMNDNDQIVKCLSKQAHADNPRLFEGNAPSVYYKMKYVPPYEKFSELKHLILCIRNATGLRSEFKGIVAVDLFEWLGREDEEYFDITLKFLYDHRHIWKYIFTFKNAELEKIKPVFEASVHYFRTMAIDKCLFNHRDELEKYLRAAFEKNGAKCDESAVQMLAGVFSGKGAKNIKSYEKMDMVIRDIADNFQNITVSGKTLTKKLGENRLVLNMLLEADAIEKIITEGEQNEHEK